MKGGYFMTNSSTPSLEKHFNLMLNWWDATVRDWHNPHLKSANVPHIPTAVDEKRRNDWHEGLNQKSLSPEALSVCERFFLLKTDKTALIFIKLDLKSLLIFSEASKCIYLAAQVEIVWEDQLSYFLSNVKYIPSEDFIPSQQFQIISKAIENAQKPFIAKFDHNQTCILSIKGSNGELEQVWNQFQAAGGMQAYYRIEETFAEEISEEKREDIQATRDYDAWKLHNKYIDLSQELYSLSGEKGDGTSKPIFITFQPLPN